MADGDSYFLKLIDQLSGPAQKMIRAIESITGSAAKATAAVDRLDAVNARTGVNAAAAATSIGRLARAQNALARIGLGRRAAAAPTLIGPQPSLAEGFMGPRTSKSFEFKELGRDLWEMNSAAGAATEKWSEMLAGFAKTPLGKLGAGIGFVAGKVWDLSKYLLEAAFSAAKMGWALGAIGAAYLTKEVIEMSAFAERARSSLAKLTGSTAEGNEAFELARKTAGDLGMSVQDVAQSFIELRAAQFSIGESDELTKLSADLATVTGHADAAGRIINAISKIKATGRLQGDELMMLAEAGLSLDMVYEKLEGTLGKSRAQILKMQSAGKISATDAIDAIKGAIIDKTHEQAAGQAAGDFAMKTLSGAWQTLQNAPKNFLLKVGEQIDTAPLVTGMRTLIDAFNMGGTDQIVAFVNKMVIGIGRFLTVLPHFVDGFSSGFGKVLDQLSFTDRDYEGGARRAGEMVAGFFEKSIDWAKKLEPALETLIAGFGEGFNLDAFLKDMEKVNFGQLALNFSSIAKDLGLIVQFAAKLVPYGLTPLVMAGDALANPGNIVNPVAGAKGRMTDQFGNDMDLGRMIQKSALPSELQGEGMFASAGRSVLGMDADEWFDPSGATGGYGKTSAPTLAPTELASRLMNGGDTTIIINGAKVTDEKELAKLIKEQLDKDKTRTAARVDQAAAR